jgi:hypothetical protein
MMEAEQQDNEDDLVEELTPTLHQESASDLATTVQTILLGGNFPRANGIFHTAGGSHWVLTTYYCKSDNMHPEEENQEK